MKNPMLLETADQVAADFCRKVAPFCEEYRIVGSVRRRVETVNDIDILMRLKRRGAVDIALWVKEQRDSTKVKRIGPKMMEIEFRGASIDLWFAKEDEWATLLLIKTGSAAHNKRLCARAKSWGWQLKAGGEGLFNGTGKRIAGDTEESFFEALELPWEEPEERD